MVKILYILNVDYIIEDINEWVSIMLEDGYSESEIRKECSISKERLIQIKKDLGYFSLRKKKAVKHLRDIHEIEEIENRLSVYKERHYSSCISMYELYVYTLKHTELLADTQSKILDEMEQLEKILKTKYRLLDSYEGVK